MAVNENAPAAATPRAAYTIPQFCEAFAISQRTYFNMRHEGWGPREMRVGRAVRISLAAAADWARAREQQSGSKATAISADANTVA